MGRCNINLSETNLAKSCYQLRQFQLLKHFTFFYKVRKKCHISPCRYHRWKAKQHNMDKRCFARYNTETDFGWISLCSKYSKSMLMERKTCSSQSSKRYDEFIWSPMKPKVLFVSTNWPAFVFCRCGATYKVEVLSRMIIMIIVMIVIANIPLHFVLINIQFVMSAINKLRTDCYCFWVPYHGSAGPYITSSALWSCRAGQTERLLHPRDQHKSRDITVVCQYLKEICHKASYWLIATYFDTEKHAEKGK